MALYKKTLAVIVTIVLYSGCLMNTAFGADQAAKEETTPPDAAGALTAEQIPPISSTLAPATNTPSRPSTVNTTKENS